MPKVRSKAEAKFWGAVAGGKSKTAPHLSPEEGKKRLRGVKVAKLPARKKKRKK